MLCVRRFKPRVYNALIGGSEAIVVGPLEYTSMNERRGRPRMTRAKAPNYESNVAVERCRAICKRCVALQALQRQRSRCADVRFYRLELAQLASAIHALFARPWLRTKSNVLMDHDLDIPNLLLGTISSDAEVPHFTHSTSLVCVVDCLTALPDRSSRPLSKSSQQKSCEVQL